MTTMTRRRRLAPSEIDVDAGFHNDKFVRYLEGSARYHESGETSVFQFLFGVA
jgi:hypothetical protein